MPACFFEQGGSHDEAALSHRKPTETFPMARKKQRSACARLRRQNSEANLGDDRKAGGTVPQKCRANKGENFTPRL